MGQFTALVMLAEIGDITRFGSARKLASWAGLTPTVRGTERIAGWSPSRGAPTVLIQNHLSVSTSTNPTAIGANIRSRGQG